jgi:hypothetical protein
MKFPNCKQNNPLGAEPCGCGRRLEIGEAFAAVAIAPDEERTAVSEGTACDRGTMSDNTLTGQCRSVALCLCD